MLSRFSVTLVMIPLNMDDEDIPSPLPFSSINDVAAQELLPVCVAFVIG